MPVLFNFGHQLSPLPSPARPRCVCVCVQVIRYLQKLGSAGVDWDEVGVISPYRKQTEKIRELMDTFGLPAVKVSRRRSQCVRAVWRAPVTPWSAACYHRAHLAGRIECLQHDLSRPVDDLDRSSDLRNNLMVYS